ncbi:MAG: hypothetical protein K2K02_07360, partial [Ruminococcus sp.]|nr:hypothetical protein [Ruminococcus sp.]
MAVEMAAATVAEKVLPVLATKMLPDFKDISGLVGVLSSNIMEYGYQNKKIISDERLHIFDGFMPIAEDFFRNLNDAVNMSIQLDDQRYSRVIDCVLENETVSLERKIEIYTALDEQKHNQKMDWIKNIGRFVIASAVIVLGGKAIQTGKELNTNKSYNKRKITEAKY